MSRWFLLLTLITAHAHATESTYQGNDADMIRLRELLRLRDETSSRTESTWEREIEADYSVDIYGCPADLEMRITREVLQSFAADIGDSLIAILFVETPEFEGQVSTPSAVAFAHYSNVVAVRKRTCDTPVESFELRSYLSHELAHIRTFNIHNFETLFPKQQWSRTDQRTFRDKWTTLSSCSGKYLGEAWRGITVAPSGYVNPYAASAWMEDVASFVEVTQLTAYHEKLDHLAVDRVRRAHTQGDSRHQGCLEQKLALAQGYRFLDEETAALVADIWSTGRSTDAGMLARASATRSLIRGRNVEALEKR